MKVGASIMSMQRAGSVPHPIGSLSGLLAWYDAADSANVVDAGGGKCSQLTDKSGNGRHLTQATDSKRPAITTSLLNTRQGLSFDGSDDFMECPAFDESVLGQESAYTLFFVMKYKSPDPTTGSSSNQVLGLGGVPTSTDRGKFCILQARDAPFTIYSNSQGAGAGADAQDTAGIPFVYHETAAAGTNGALNWYLNNVVKKTQNTTTTSRVNINQTYFHLHLGVDPAFFNIRHGIIDFGELCIFNRVLNSTEQTQVHDFLKSKWGI